MLKAITPVAVKKFKTPGSFQPHNLVNGKATMDEFLDLQKRFLAISEKIRTFDLEKNKDEFRNFPNDSSEIR